MTPVSDYNTISYSHTDILLSAARLFLTKPSQDQFIKMHSVDGYRPSSRHLDNHGVSGHSFILENIPIDSHLNTLVSWSVAQQASHHPMQRRRRLQKQVHGAPVRTFRCGIDSSAENGTRLTV